MKTKTLTPQQALDSTKRKQYVDKDIVKTMPPATGETITFFKLDKYYTDAGLLKEYERRGLKPASPIDLCAYDVAHPDVVDEMKYVATIWDTVCYLTFGGWGGREVRCDRLADGWGDVWFLAGVPAPGKSSALEPSAQPSDTSSLEKRVAALEAIVKHHNLGV